ncbi:hypothetical protein JCM8208_006232 [Rhodotorula glutinis]
MATFNDLPIELVEHIWSFLADDLAGKRHLCTAVVPLVRRHNFGSTRIYSKRRLHSFAGLVERSDPLSRWFVGVKSVAEYVRDVELDHTVATHRTADPVAIKNALASINVILCRCREVERIFSHGQLVMRVLLSSQALPAFNLLMLKEILFFEVDTDPGAPLSQGHFVHLRRFPALRELLIDFVWDDGSAFETAQAPHRHHVGPSPVTKLSLYAGESLTTPGAALFIADFAQLTYLDLNLRGGIDLGPFLQACPLTLTVLKIHYCDELLQDDEQEVDPLHVEADLARFVHLTDLTLGASMFSPTCELFPILSSHLPRLRTLTLEPGTRLVANKVLHYVLARGGPARRLDKLVLDSVSVHLHPLPSQSPDRPDVVDGTFRFRHRWMLPNWTRRFGLADAHKLLATAKRVGVQVEGTILRAVEYDEVREREEAYLQTRRDEVLYSLRALFGEGDE